MSISKVILKGYILVSDADLPQVLAELPTHIELTRAEAGCLVFEVLQDPEHINKFDVYEEFSDQQAFELHQERTRASKWARVTAKSSRHYTVEGLP